MYHIKSDKRSQTSAAEVVRGLQECLKVQPLKSVTVTDIHRVTGISRATFYRLFDTPEDVLRYQLDQMADAVEQLYERERELPADKLMERTVAAGLENHDFIRALVENGRFDLLYQYTERNFRSLDDARHIFPENMTGPERDYVISHLSMDMVASLITWNRNGRQDSPADIVRYLKSYVQIVSGMIREE